MTTLSTTYHLWQQAKAIAAWAESPANLHAIADLGVGCSELYVGIQTGDVRKVTLAAINLATMAQLLSEPKAINNVVSICINASAFLSHVSEALSGQTEKLEGAVHYGCNIAHLVWQRYKG